MKAVFTIIAVAASLAAAADSPASALPPCTQTCVGKFMTGSSVAGCGQLDVKCICKNDDFISDISCCIIENNCDQASKDATLKIAHQICMGIRTDIPDKIECKKTTSSQAASAGASDASGVSSAVSSPTSTVTKGSSNSHSSAAATSTSNVAPVNGAGMLGAAAVLAFAL